MVEQPMTPLINRDQTADLLKGIAVVLMIQVHLIEQFATLEVYQSTLGRLSLFLGGPPAAPVFLAVMGYYLAQSKKSLAQFIRRGVLLTIGGLLLNIGLNANLLYAIHRGRFQLDPLAFVFGADILPLAGLSVIVITFMRKVAKDRAVAYVLLALFVAAVTPFLPKLAPESTPFVLYVVPFFWGDSWWSYFPLFPWLAYPLLGFAFGQASALREQFVALSGTTRLSIVIAVAAILVFASSYAIEHITELPHYYHHGIILFAWISGFLFVWLMAVSAFENRFSSAAPFRYLKWHGRSVTSAFVFQWLIIGNVATEIYRTQGFLQIALWFPAVLCGVSLLAYVLQSVRERTAVEKP